MSKRTVWVLVIGGLAALFLATGVVIAAVIAWHVGQNRTLLGTDTESVSAAQIQSLARITLPHSVQNVQAHLKGFQDPILHVRFTMLPQDESAFWQSSPCASAQPLSAPTTDFLHSPTRPWWRPPAAGNLEFRSIEGKGFVESILIDKTDPAAFIVYVQFLDR